METAWLVGSACITKENYVRTKNSMRHALFSVHLFIIFFFSLWDDGFDFSVFIMGIKKNKLQAKPRFIERNDRSKSGVITKAFNSLNWEELNTNRVCNFTIN